MKRATGRLEVIFSVGWLLTMAIPERASHLHWQPISVTLLSLFLVLLK